MGDSKPTNTALVNEQHTPDIELQPSQTNSDNSINRLNDADFIKGVSYLSNSKGAYSSDASKIVFTELLSPLGIEWISVIPYCTQTSKKSTEIDCTDNYYRPDDVDIVNVIDIAHQNNMKVMLIPHLYISSDEDSWRGEIGFDNNEQKWAEWFANYSDFILHYAHIAEATSADYFVVGSELETASHRENEWRALVRRVRDVYHGPITYSANFGDEAELTVQWWDALDSISIDAYYPLTEKKDPTLDELIAAWQPIVTNLEALSNKWGKPIIFTEIGYQSKDGTNTGGWNVEDEETLDFAEQADCYQAVFEVFSAKEWWQGVFFWAWDTNPMQGGLADDDFEIRGKPAEDIVRMYYGGQDEESIVTELNLIPDESLNMSIYTESLQNGWQDYSYFGNFNFYQSKVVAFGDKSIEAKLDEWGGVCMANEVIDTNPYYWIEFYINYGNDTTRKLWMSGYGENDQDYHYRLNIMEPRFYHEGKLKNDHWHLVRIPLSDLGIKDKPLSKICIADGSGEGQAKFWLDEISLIGAKEQ